MKHLGLVSIILLWAGLIFLIRNWKGNVSMTFSQHAAQTKASQIYYLMLFAIVLPLFTLFGYRWFIPELNLPVWFSIIFGIGLIGNAIAAIVPETKGKKVLIHRISAFTMADCLVPLLYIIVFSSQLPTAVRVAAALAGAYQTIGVIILAPRAGHHPQVLPLQASYVAVFHVTILLATYIR